MLNTQFGSGTTILLVLGFMITLVMIIGLWKVFNKAKQPGWASLVPIYNFVTLLRVAKLPVILILLLIFPATGIPMFILLYAKVGIEFKKGFWFCLGLILLNPIFIIILGFDKSEYNKIE